MGAVVVSGVGVRVLVGNGSIGIVDVCFGMNTKNCVRLIAIAIEERIGAHMEEENRLILSDVQNNGSAVTGKQLVNADVTVLTFHFAVIDCDVTIVVVLILKILRGQNLLTNEVVKIISIILGILIVGVVHNAEHILLAIGDIDRDSIAGTGDPIFSKLSNETIINLAGVAGTFKFHNVSIHTVDTVRIDIYKVETGEIFCAICSGNHVIDTQFHYSNNGIRGNCPRVICSIYRSVRDVHLSRSAMSKGSHSFHVAEVKHAGIGHIDNGMLCAFHIILNILLGSYTATFKSCCGQNDGIIEITIFGRGIERYLALFVYGEDFFTKILDGFAFFAAFIAVNVEVTDTSYSIVFLVINIQAVVYINCKHSDIVSAGEIVLSQVNRSVACLDAVKRILYHILVCKSQHLFVCIRISVFTDIIVILKQFENVLANRICNDGFEILLNFRGSYDIIHIITTVISNGNRVAVSYDLVTNINDFAKASIGILLAAFFAAYSNSSAGNHDNGVSGEFGNIIDVYAVFKSTLNRSSVDGYNRGGLKSITFKSTDDHIGAVGVEFQFYAICLSRRGHQIVIIFTVGVICVIEPNSSRTVDHPSGVQRDDIGFIFFAAGLLAGFGCSSLKGHLNHNSLFRHGEGVLAINGSDNIHVIALVRSHNEGLPCNGIYFVAFVGVNADGDGLTCCGDTGHCAVATAGGVANLIVIEYIENFGFSCILLCSKVAYGTYFNEGEKHRHAALSKNRTVRNRFSIARDSAVICTKHCVVNNGEVSAIRIYNGHNRQLIVLFDDIAIRDAKQEFGVQPISAAKHFQHLSQTIGRETIKSGSNNRIANFVFVTIGHLNRKDCHFNGAVNSACAIHEYGPVVILVKPHV